MALVYLVTLLSLVLFMVGILLSVAFMILLERSVLSYVQIRKGPNKVSFMGIIQSFGDAIKLFIKEQGYPSFSNLSLYYFAPILSIMVMLLVWMVLPTGSGVLNFNVPFIFLFSCLSLGVYVLMSSGWSSNSNYALLGAVRGVAQTISYEVSLILLVLSLIFLLSSFSLSDLMVNQELVWFFLGFFPILICWLVTMLAEANRTPFDFAEGESELVSGFNIEYGSGGFALLFLAEYGMIIFMSYLVSYMFFGGLDYTMVEMNLSGLFFCFFFLWVRGTLPRFRYDKLMSLVWSGILPISLNFLLFYFAFGLLVVF